MNWKGKIVSNITVSVFLYLAILYKVPSYFIGT